MPHEVKRRNRASDKVVHLHNQADRARMLALQCGSQLVADLLEDHARLCERNAELRHLRVVRKSPT